MDDEEDKDADCILSVSRKKRDVKEAAGGVSLVVCEMKISKRGIRNDVKRYLILDFVHTNSIDEMNKNIKNKK